jgi:hypothetical protein
MGRFLEFLAEAISPEDRKKITDYAKGLKSWLKKNYPGLDWKVTTMGSLKANPYIDVRCGWPEKKVPNELRLKLVDAVYPNGRSGVRNIDDIEYGNISERGLAALYTQWVTVTGEQLNESKELSIGDKVKKISLTTKQPVDHGVIIKHDDGSLINKENHYNVKYDDGTISRTHKDFLIKECLNESGMIRITVPYTDRRMTQKTLDNMGFDYEIGNGTRGATAIFDITIDEYQDSELIKNELRSKKVRLLNESEDQSKIIQGYCPTITDSKERLFVAFSGGLTKDYKKSYCVSEKEAIEIAERYIKRFKYDGTPGAVPVNVKNELLNESSNEDLITAYETGKKAGEAHANKDQSSVSHHSDWFKKFKRLSKTDKQALEAEYTKGYRETSGFNNKPSYFR